MCECLASKRYVFFMSKGGPCLRIRFSEWLQLLSESELVLNVISNGKHTGETPPLAVTEPDSRAWVAPVLVASPAAATVAVATATIAAAVADDDDEAVEETAAAYDEEGTDPVADDEPVGIFNDGMWSVF